VWRCELALKQQVIRFHGYLNGSPCTLQIAGPKLRFVVVDFTVALKAMYDDDDDDNNIQNAVTRGRSDRFSTVYSTDKSQNTQTTT